MKFLQKLGKSLMLPVVCLPICGILMGIGYLLCPASMQGGNIQGVANSIGYFLVKAGGALVDNIALLFAIGVGIGMSENNDGIGALTALISWLVITCLLKTQVIKTVLPEFMKDEIRAVAFDKIANPFTGMIAGLIGAFSYNRFKNTKLPQWLSFFSGKRSTTIISGLLSILAAVILLFVWPFLFKGMVLIGSLILKLGAAGAGIYAFLNRLLIPFGLHHALNSIFWFDTIGIGDLTHFWAGHTSADVSWSLGMYMSGFFPCMMFGIPGAALAMIRCAKPKKKKKTIGIMASNAVASFLSGVTEPFEFSFMFAAPKLYLVYSLLFGIVSTVTVLSGFRAGFSFSAGTLDLLFSMSLPAADKTWLIIPIGIGTFILFYLVFFLAIKKWNLKTPGREEDDVNDEGNALAEKNYAKAARIILTGLGGRENIVSVDNCITRLRLEIKDTDKTDEKKIKSSGASGVIKAGKNSVQVVIGVTVQFVADELKKLCEGGEEPEEKPSKFITHEMQIFKAAAEPVTAVNRLEQEAENELQDFQDNCFSYVIKDPVGIHARPAGMIAKIAGKYAEEISIEANGKTASANSITELMSLSVKEGDEVTVKARGENAQPCLNELFRYFEENM